MLYNAVDFATEVHKNEVRKFSGKPYISHCFDVMEECIRCGETDLKVLSAAILHDTLESTWDEYKSEKIIDAVNTLLLNEFGGKVSGIVCLCSYFPGLDSLTKDQWLRFVSYYHDDAVFVKACDRICNVYDFLDSDPTYAKIYFEKANVIWQACERRDSKFELLNKHVAELRGIL